MDNGDYYYNFVFEDRFLESLAAIIGPQRVEEALITLFDSLYVYPAKFPLVPGMEPIRLAKTDPHYWEGGLIPRLRIWYYIEDADVHFLDIAVDLGPF